MKRAALIVGVFVLGLSAGCSLHIRHGEAAVTSADVVALERAEELGEQIYLHDRAAAQATEMLLSHGVNLTAAGTRGWITEDHGDRFVVTFVAGDPQQWRSVSRVTFVETAEPNIILVDKDLTERQSAMFDARQRVLESIVRVCSDAYNTVVLPRADEEGWLAYALAATSDPNLVLVGGHYRATVSADGLTLLDRRGFAKDCTALRRSEDTKREAETAAYQLVHVLDDRPTEIHVFLSLLYGKPLFIATADRRLWHVANGEITLLKRL